MYGLINDAIRRVVLEEAGEDAWQRIVEDADAGSHTFAAMAYYDDDLTYDLVAAASRELRSPPDVLLRRFGRYWSVVIAPESYGDYLAAAGRDMWEVLAGLDGMHARLQALFPQLRPPSIDVEPRREHLITVNYRSEREGLAPFMVGMLEGLAEHLEVTAAVTHLSARGGDLDHDVFEVAI